MCWSLLIEATSGMIEYLFLVMPLFADVTGFSVLGMLPVSEEFNSTYLPNPEVMSSGN